MKTFIAKLKNSNDIREKELGDNISSFNFTRDVFYSSRWNNLNKIARGLFINTKNNEIVARSYPKFFNFEECNNTIEWLKENLSFPITCYHKYNGFLGLVSYNKEKDDFFIASKSTNQGDFANWMKDLFLTHIYKYNIVDKLKSFIKENNCTFIFEAVDIIHDPHIIEYHKNKLILLDVVYNTIEFNKMDYKTLQTIADEFKFEVKKIEYILNNFDELEELFNKFNNPNQTTMFEGFVIEDINRYMFKFKTYFYRYWKHIRSLKEKFVRKKEKGEKLIADNVEDNKFIEYFEQFDIEELKQKNIIQIRKEFLEQNNKQIINIINEIQRFIYILRPTKNCDKLDKWIESIEDVYSKGCCLNFAMALKYVFQNKYKCSIVGRGSIVNNEKINEIKELVKNNQFNHYLLKVDYNNRFALFDIFGYDYDYNDENNNTWFDNYQEFLILIKDKKFNNKNWLTVYHQLTNQELKKLCSIWNIKFQDEKHE